MCDSYWDPGLFRGHESEYTNRIHMRMHNAWLNLRKLFSTSIHILDWIAVRRNVEHTPTQRLNLVSRNCSGIRLYYEIKLHSATVDMTVMIHHSGFDSATHHPANYLCYTNGHWSPPYLESTPT